jgi:hypothetical protein
MVLVDPFLLFGVVLPAVAAMDASFFLRVW